MASVSPDSLNRSPSDIEEVAARWFVAVDRGLSTEQRREFEAWLEADPAHRELFEELGGTWEVMGHAKAVEDVPEVGMASRKPSFWRAAGKLVLPLAAAAAIGLVYYAWWRPAHYSGEANTLVGAMRVLKLPDGSLVELNTDSTLYAAFTPAERRVKLVKGEAHFQVAKNKERPFIVESGGIDVRAVGTAFDVRLKSDRVDVLVTEGRVRVGTDLGIPRTASAGVPVAPPVPYLAELGAGEQVSVSRVPALQVESRPVPVAPEDVQRRLAWQQRKLDFVDTPLGEMVAEFNRYNTHQLVVADEELATHRFGGIFRADDPAGFVRMLQVNFKVQAEEKDGVTVLKAGR